MIEYFVEKNELEAVIHPNTIVNDFFVRAKLFLIGRQGFLVLTPRKALIDMEKLGKALGTSPMRLREAEQSDCLDVTGYKKDFLPPVSIYGITIIIDKKLEKFKKLFFPLENDCTLEISLDEILGFNEDVVQEDVT